MISCHKKVEGVCCFPVEFAIETIVGTFNIRSYKLRFFEYHRLNITLMRDSTREVMLEMHS